MKFVDSIKKDFNTMTWVLIPVAIAINVVVGQIVLVLKLPVYLELNWHDAGCRTVWTMGRSIDRRTFECHLGPSN